jgi:hypothetical protein
VPIALLVKIDSMHRIENNSIADVKSIAVWPAGTLGRNENPPMVGRIAKSLPVSTERENCDGAAKERPDAYFSWSILEAIQ